MLKIGWIPTYHPYHPNNKDKRRFGPNSKVAPGAKPQAMQLTGSLNNAIFDVSTASPDFSIKMDALQYQLNSIMQYLNKGIKFDNSTTPHTTSNLGQYSLATHLTGTTIFLHFLPHIFLIMLGF